MEVADDQDLLDSINVAVYPDGQAVNLEVLFGDSITYNADGEVVDAAAMTQVRSAPRRGTYDLSCFRNQHFSPCT